MKTLMICDDFKLEMLALLVFLHATRGARGYKYMVYKVLTLKTQTPHTAQTRTWTLKLIEKLRQSYKPQNK